MKSLPPLSLQSPSDARVLPVVRQLVQVAGEAAGLDDQAAYEAVVAVSEACSNIIRHAHRNERQQSFSLDCQTAGRQLEILLRDQGPPFDFAAAPELDPTETRLGGRGIYLIRRLMEEVASRPLPTGGNELRMVKRRAAEL